MKSGNLVKIVGALGIAAMIATGTGIGTASADTQPTEVYSQITSADIADPTAILTTDNASGDFTTLQTVEGAISWFRSREGSTEQDGYCERAVRLAWNRTTHHASAIDHWNSGDGARHTTGNPPRGAFVFWNISSFGHVGLSDGSGGVWATSVNGRIGHVSRGYFSNYLGWKPGNSN
jgi:hypothetical protein